MTIDTYQTVKNIGVSWDIIRKTVRYVLARQKKSVGEVRIHCIGLASMRRLNMTHRGKDHPTDVLSFPGVGYDSGWPENPRESKDLGDIFLCPSYVKQQARRFGVLYREEFQRMLIHGILHLVGYDHQTRRDAAKMFALQETYLTALIK